MRASASLGELAGAVPSDAARIDAFLEQLAASKGASANTLDAYRRDLEEASHFLAGGLVSAQAEDLSAFMVALSRAGRAASTLARKRAALRHFFKVQFQDKVRAKDPTAALASPNGRREIPDVLSRAEVARLIDACEADVRLVCLVELLYGAGLRASELVSLPMGALPRRRGGTWESRALIIRGKGVRDRMCPLGAPALDALSCWLDARGESEPGEGPGARKPGRASPFVFPSRGKSGHLTRRRLGQMLADLAPKAGLSRARVHPHALRHAYGTHLLEGGADLRSLQALLGHADISTTQIYTHVRGEALMDLVSAHHPLSSAPLE
ncbi:MAG: tyrosine-type recombinase/integrase [Pseudomonadota bacterium]